MDDLAIIGVGMHPWVKCGRNFAEYGTFAAREALAEARVDWRDVGYISGAITVRNGYPGYVAGSTFARALGFNGAQVSSSYSACASGVTALQVARGQIFSGVTEVALVVGADTTPKGFLKPNEGDRPDDLDWLRFKLVGATNPVYFGLNARRRMDVFGATSEDFARVKVKNSRHAVHNERARFTKEYDVDDVLNSPVVSDPLRLLDICATSDGGAALVVCSLDYARSLGHDDPVRIGGLSTVTPTYPDTMIDLPYIATDSAGATAEPLRGFKESIGDKVYEEAGLGPEDVDVAEVYDLSSSLELDWYEQLGFCAEGEAEQMLRNGDTEIGGRLPVNPSGGLGAFGEAVPAQAIAQVCELVWQLRGQAGRRQVEGARVGITANQGLFGHGSSVLVRR
jgi:acetyl-CoA acetyltransferase